MIEVKDLTKKYDTTTAVDHISFSIPQGEIVGLLGPNGAGKTTTIKMLTGYLAPTEGEARIQGMDIQTDSLKVRQKIGYLSENAPLYEDMNVAEYLRFAGELHDIPKTELSERFERVVSLCGLHGRTYQDISELSKGYRQRVGLAQSLIHDPEILILDEPTSGLDPNQRIEIRELIRKIGKEKTVVLSSHVLSEVEATCDRVLIIHKGRIVAQGSPKDLTHDAQKQTRIFLALEGDVQRIESVLRSFAPMHQILEITPKGSEVSVVLEVAPDTDYRKALVEHIRGSGLSLLEIYQKQQSLEDIFVQLTRE